ncbi:MAG TPA: GNAT family N-acetyltransferase [Sporichthya sp.]|nr:GNAT family N-acetyltransferase [Sporichthya sp.]
MSTLTYVPDLATDAEVVTPAPRAIWRDLLAAQGPTPIESTPDWMDCIVAAGRHVDASRLYRLGHGRSVLVPLAAPRFGGRLAPVSSLPFVWGFGGLVTGGTGQSAAEIASVLDDLTALPTIRLRVAMTPGVPAAWTSALAGRFPRLDERTVHLLDLPASADELLRGYSVNRRKAVRRAERRGVEIEVDRTGRRLDVFYELYDASIERWAAEQHEPLALCRWRNHRANSRAKLATVARVLGERCAVWTAWVEGRPAAASIVLTNGEYVTAWKSAANIREFGPTCAVDLLKHTVITDALEHGARVYDLGESRPGSNLAKFKAAFGAREERVTIAERERLPLREADELARGAVRRVIGFRDR